MPAHVCLACLKKKWRLCLQTDGVISVYTIRIRHIANKSQSLRVMQNDYYPKLRPPSSPPYNCQENCISTLVGSQEVQEEIVFERKYQLKGK